VAEAHNTVVGERDITAHPELELEPALRSSVVWMRLAAA
jgi:hypothetical protein